MAEAQLSVELTAKIDGLRDNFNAAIREVGKLDKDTRAKLSSIDKGFEDLANSAEVNISGKVSGSVKATSNSVSQNLAKMAAASAKAGQGVAVGSNQAANALTNLGRVAQDAPFGFIGIQNNLNPLLESFQRLREETGSGSAALKALGSSLIGPAGLGIALSVISAGVLLYTQYQQKHNKVLKESKSTSDDYISTLDQLSQVQLKGAENALKEQTELTTLYGITQNVTLSHKQRLDAVNALQDKYPSYFKNIKDENFLNGEAKSAYDDLTTSILATARARAAQDLITKNSTRQLENETKVTKLRVEQQKALAEENRLSRINDSANRNTGGSGFGSTGSAISESLLNGAKEKRLAIEKQINDLLTDSNILTDKNVQLTKSVNTEIVKGADLTGKVGAIDTNKAKEVKTLADVMKELNIELLQAANNGSGTFGDQQKEKVNDYQKAIDELIKLGYKPAGEAIQKLKAQQQGLFDKDAMGDDLLGKATPLNLEKLIPSTDPILVKPVLKLQPVITGLTDAEKSMQKLGEDFGKLTQNSIGGALADAGSAIGEALASGNNVIQALGTSLLKSFGGFLSELGRLLISYGAAALLKAQLDLSLAIPGAAIITGPAAIAAGVALEIAGSAIGAFASGKSGNNSGSTYQKPTAFANGGIIYGPTLGLMGEYAGAKSDPEVVAPLSKLKSILGGQNDSGANVTNVNNGSPVILSHEIQMRGRDLWLIVKQEEAKQKRI